MATEALRISDDGPNKIVNINSIDKEDRNATYICCGMVRGKLCRAKMIPVFGETPYFRSAPDSKHIYACPHDESKRAVIRRHLDVTGSKTTVEELLSDFDKGETQVRKKQASQGAGTKTSEKGEAKQAKEEPMRIIREARNPRNLKELCELLVNTEPDELYANTPVRRIIVDRRTIKDYRADGLSDGQTAVVLCSRIKSESLDRYFPDRDPQELVLRDAFSFESQKKPMLFAFRTSLAVKNMIFSAPKEHIIAIFAQWHPHPKNPCTYICDHVQPGHVFLAEKDFFDGAF